MPAEIDGTWRVLDQGVGVRRKLVARRVGRPLSSFEKQLLPPPSLEFPNGNGVTNDLDRVLTIIDFAEHPHLILDFICQRYGGQFVLKGQRQGHLAATPSDVRSLAMRLALAIDEGADAERLRELRDELSDVAHLAVEQAETENPSEED